MIPVFFTNQNHTTMLLNEAKHLITTAPDKDTAIRTYLECWKQLYKREDKVKLEVWWHQNNNQLKFYHDNSHVIQGEKEVVELILSTDEQQQCEAEIEAMERDLKIEQLSYLMENNN